MKNLRLLFAASILTLTACAVTSTHGVVPFGNHYMIGSLGGMFDYSGSVEELRLMKQAQQFCANRGKGVVLLASKDRDAGWDKYSSAELQFACK